MSVSILTSESPWGSGCRRHIETANDYLHHLVHVTYFLCIFIELSVVFSPKWFSWLTTPAMVQLVIILVCICTNVGVVSTFETFWPDKDPDWRNVLIWLLWHGVKHAGVSFCFWFVWFVFVSFFHKVLVTVPQSPKWRLQISCLSKTQR